MNFPVWLGIWYTPTTPPIYSQQLFLVSNCDSSQEATVKESEATAKESEATPESSITERLSSKRRTWTPE
jgi:hypothetical protein